MRSRLPLTPPLPCRQLAGLGRSSEWSQKTGIVRDELVPQPVHEAAGAEMAQIVVEVAELWAKYYGENAGRACALAEALDAVPAGGIGVGRDV